MKEFPAHSSRHEGEPEFELPKGENPELRRVLFKVKADYVAEQLKRRNESA